MRWIYISVLLTALVLPAFSAARIVPDQCIDGVGLLDTQEQVLKQWGPPLRKERRASYESRWHYRRGSVVLVRWYRPSPNIWHALVIETSDPRQQTPSGIGPGSSLRQVRAAYPHAGCRRRGSCEIGKLNYRFTTLELKAGRVTKVTLSVDSSYDDGGLPSPERRCAAIS